jgi:hypothetical protein
MTKRDKVSTALGGLLGAGIYLFFIVWLNDFFHADRPDTPMLLLGTGLSLALGCMAGLATRPFADDGFTLIRNSLLQYVVTAGLFTALIQSMGGNALACIDWAGILSVLYLLIWLARWIGWYMEVMQLRQLLGLSPGPSPLHWRETLPYLPYVLLLCDALPLAAFLVDKLWADIPVLSGVVVPFLLLPVIGFSSGLSLGKRQGVCLIYPVACFVCYLPMVFILFNSSAMFHCFMVSVPALLGNVIGWMYRRAVPKKR